MDAAKKSTQSANNELYYKIDQLLTNLSFLRFQPGFPHRKSLQYLKHLHLLQSDLLTLAVLPVQMDCFHNESWV